MKTNFKIISFTEIEFENEEIDLHNCYDFISNELEVTNEFIKIHFVITGMQFWVSDYMQEVMHLKSSMTYIIYAIVSISAPALGVLTGGFLIQYLGGYTDEKALNACCKLTFVGFICASILPLFDYPIIFVIFMWLMLFFESSVTPGLTGLMIATIPDNYKEIGN